MRKRSYQLEYSESSYYGDDFSERVQAAIDEAREEIDRETELYRVDLERAYRDKVGQRLKVELRMSTLLLSLS